jgi:hypothetical protein
MASDGETIDMPKEAVAEMREQKYAEDLDRLGFLQEKGIDVTALGESKVGDLVASGQVRADIAVFIIVDEHGVGTFQPPAKPIPISSGLAPDFGPGGLPAALTYLMPFFGTVVPGDVILVKPGTAAVISDVIRFNPPMGNTPPSLVFYSDVDADHSGVPADTGFPPHRVLCEPHLADG